jgi:hypothetical protein
VESKKFSPSMRWTQSVSESYPIEADFENNATVVGTEPYRPLTPNAIKSLSDQAFKPEWIR